MHAIRDLSIKTKLLLLSGVSVAVALTLSCVGFTLHEVYTARAIKADALQVQAKSLAFNSTGVLSFHDVSAAERLLASLRSQPTIEFGCLYDSTGGVLATYPGGTGAQAAPPLPSGDECRFTNTGHVEVFRRVVDRGEPVGTLYLRANVDDLRQQLTNYEEF